MSLSLMLIAGMPADAAEWSIFTAIAFFLKCFNSSVSISGDMTSFLEVGGPLLQKIPNPPLHRYL
jgi:hypothetical protein